MVLDRGYWTRQELPKDIVATIAGLLRKPVGIAKLVRLVYTASREGSMTETYSTYEAKAKFSEIIRKVRAGQRVVIAYRGEEVAEIRPIERGNRLEKSLGRLEDRGLLSRARKPTGPLKLLVRKPGALARFLESRE